MEIRGTVKLDSDVSTLIGLIGRNFGWVQKGTIESKREA